MNHSVHLALYVFATIFIAELPDKTALATVVLAARSKPVPVFWGAALALTVQSAVAVAAGSVLTLLPPIVVRIGSALVFFASALVMAIRGFHGRTAEGEGDGKKVEGAAVSTLGAVGPAGTLPLPAPPPAAPESSARTFAMVFGVIFLAEWGDLTQFATAALAARERAPGVVFAASTAALWVVAAIAVTLGHRAARVVRQDLLERAAAVIFALIGIALITGWS